MVWIYYFKDHLEQRVHLAQEDLKDKLESVDCLACQVLAEEWDQRDQEAHRYAEKKICNCLKLLNYFFKGESGAQGKPGKEGPAGQIGMVGPPGAMGK